MTQLERLHFLNDYLLDESPQYKSQALQFKDNEYEQFRLFRSLVNIRLPKSISDEFINVQNVYLQKETERKGITDLKKLSPIKDNIYLWKGDITTLKCDAIVNAANSALLGCFYPCHGCIDNAIHTYSGVQLRLECNDIMQKQGYDEPTGKAKITKAYNLPCNYVIHTVGPIIDDKLTESDCKKLELCYTSCYNTALINNLDSIAFCCISTGEFHFPNDKAVQIAVDAVTRLNKENNSDMKVIFNVFKTEDYNIYGELLTADKRD